MTDNEFPVSDLEVFRLLADGAAADELASEIEDGFSADRARLFLDSAERFEDLADLVYYVEPGSGWYRAAAQPDELGTLNRRLLTRALEVRHNDPDDLYQVTRSEGWTRLAQRHGWLDVAETTSVTLPGGTATWASRGAGLPSAVEYSGAQPGWLEDLLGAECAAALSDGAGALSPDETRTGDLLSRYALGLWLERWHPGGTVSHAFPEGLLRLELGTVAWRAAEALGSTAEARRWLADGGDEIVALAGLLHTWSGWPRALAAAVLDDAALAYVDLFPDASDAARVRGIVDGLGEAGSDVIAPRPPARRALALVAGVTLAYGDQAEEFAVDPAQVPARSVSAAARNALVEIVEGASGTQIRVSVAQGQQPVPALAATLVVDGDSHVIALPLSAGGYEGVFDGADEPHSVDVHVHEPGRSGPFRGADAIEETLRYIDAVLAARRAVYEDLDDDGEGLRGLPSVPFLAEIAGWRDDL